METRKLQQVGGGTYTVSIPKEWAERHRFEAGSDVHLYAHDDGSIVLRSARKDGGALTSTRATVDGTGTRLVERALKATYAIGFETVVLEAPDGFTTDQRRTARSVTQALVGTEVVDETDDRIEVRDLLSPADVSIRQSLVQLQFVALSMHRDATEPLTGADHVETESIRRRDDEADRLFGMIARHFNRSLASLAEVDHLALTRPALFDYYLTARQLERVADHAVRIVAATNRTETPAPSEIADELASLADASRGVVEEATGAVLGDESSASPHDVLDRRDETVRRIAALDQVLFERAPADAYAITRVLDSLTRTAECGGNVAEVAVQAAQRPGRGP